MLVITENISILDEEISFKAIRSSGPGGQHVNKVNSAVQLKFDIRSSSLPNEIKEQLLHFNDHRVTKDGVFIIKVQETRSQITNRKIGLDRLKNFLISNMIPLKNRKLTKPSKSSIRKTKEDKKRRSQTKKMRNRIEY